MPLVGEIDFALKGLMSVRRYKNPPIEEALCEFRFLSETTWHAAIPGQLYEFVKGEYSGTPIQQEEWNANVTMSAQGGGTPGLALGRGAGKVQFPNSDGTRRLTAGPDTLSVHTLDPYDGWENFRSRIETALEAYRSILQPRTIRRLGVRYINRILIPKRTVELSEFFRCAPPRIDDLPGIMSQFLHRTQYEWEDGIKLLLTFASTGTPHVNTPSFLLDLDVVWEGEHQLNGIMDLVDDLHDREGKSFEAIITDAARRLFDD